MANSHLTCNPHRYRVGISQGISRTFKTIVLSSGIQILNALPPEIVNKCVLSSLQLKSLSFDNSVIYLSSPDFQTQHPKKMNSQYKKYGICEISLAFSLSLTSRFTSKLHLSLGQTPNVKNNNVIDNGGQPLSVAANQEFKM